MPTSPCHSEPQEIGKRRSLKYLGNMVRRLGGSLLGQEFGEGLLAGGQGMEDRTSLMLDPSSVPK